MKRILSALLIAAAAACSPKTEKVGDAAEPAPAQEAAQKRLPLADCATVEPTVGADGKLSYTDCRGMVSGDGGLAFEARYVVSDAGDATVNVQVVAPGDATLQAFSEVMDTAGAAPSSQDVDGDGRGDILVPRYQGMVNTTWAVWLQGEGQTFARAGELFGVDIQKTETGYIAAPGRSSADTWTISFVKLENGALMPQASVDVKAEGKDDGTITGWTCSLSPDAQLAPGLSAEAAKKQFCAEPVAAEIFK